MQMRTDGNVNQWKDSTHTFDTVLADVERGECYVVEDDGSMVATFVLMLREESTYSRIDGAWLRDAPYVTIHRLASDGHRGGIAHFVFDWRESGGATCGWIHTLTTCACNVFLCNMDLCTVAQSGFRMEHPDAHTILQHRRVGIGSLP